MLPGDLVDGRFEIVELVARGGMGAIYRAIQHPLGRTVAIKIIRPELSDDTELLQRFRLEAQTISRLEHQNTVRIYDFDYDDLGRMFLAMEWLDGESLANLLIEQGPMSSQRCALIGMQCASSLAEAHRKGIVHRDLKPANIFLLAQSDPPDFVKVLDFGIAKLMDQSATENITRVGAICGTPEFMSPEQGLANELDGRSDLYSLGCCLFAMLTARAPFTDPMPLRVLAMHQQAPLPELPPHVDRRLAHIITKCTAKNPDERYPTADALADALKAMLAAPEEEDIGLLSNPFSAQQTIKQAAQPRYAPSPVVHTVPMPSLRRGRITPGMVARILCILCRLKKTGQFAVARQQQVMRLSLKGGKLLRDPQSRRSIETLMAAVAWDAGSYEFLDTEVPDEGEPVDTFRLVYDSLRLHLSMNQLAIELGEKNTLFPAYTQYLELCKSELQELGIASMLELCDGQADLNRLFMSASGGFEEVARAVHFGYISHTLVFLNKAQTAPVQIEFGPEAQPAEGHGALISTSRVSHVRVIPQQHAPLNAAEQQLIRTMQERQRGFEGPQVHAAFGLPPGYDERQIDDAYYELVAKLHPDRFADYDHPEVKEQINNTFIALQNAHQRLLLSSKQARPTQPRIRALDSSAQAPESPRYDLPNDIPRPPSSPIARPSSAAVSRPISTVHSPASGTRTTPSTVGVQRPPSNAIARPPSSNFSPTSSPSARPPRPSAAPVSTRPPARSPAPPPPAARPIRMSDILAERAAEAQRVAESDSVPEIDTTPTQNERARMARPAIAGLKSAAELLRQGIKQLAQQQNEQAKRSFQVAHQTEPKNAEISAYLTWAEFLCEPSTVDTAKQSLRELRKEKEAAIPASYFLGKIAMQSQDFEAAKGYFEAVLARDPRHVDATRELRLVKQRIQEAEETKTLFGRLKRKVKTALETE
ncbi:MAG: protein kinase [Myxococcota bacterium]|nr:protein kinase [Myxococcota bacterium]